MTLGSQGSVLVRRQNDNNKHDDEGKAVPRATLPVVFCRACSLPPETEAVEETGAGDCYRAGFAVALSESRRLRLQSGATTKTTTTTMEHCMRFASAAGVLAVIKRGAVPSVWGREETERLMGEEFGAGSRGKGSRS